MSFADLWDQVDLVVDHSEYRREGVEDLLDLLNSRVALEIKYCQALDKLSDSDKCVSRSGSLAQAVAAVKTHWQHRAAKGKTMASIITDELVKPLELLLAQQSALTRAQDKEAKALAKNLAQQAEKYEIQLQQYEGLCHEAERRAKSLTDEVTEDQHDSLKPTLALLKMESDVAVEECIESLHELNSVRSDIISSLVTLR